MTWTQPTNTGPAEAAAVDVDGGDGLDGDGRHEGEGDVGDGG